MNLRLSGLTVLLAACATFSPLQAQEQHRVRLDATHYTIDADINPATQTLTAQVQLQFSAAENTSSIALELNNGLNVSRIVDGSNRQIPTSRSQGDSTIRLNFPDGITKDQPVTLTINYEGRLTGQEESPVYGIKFASIQKDHAFLMYPARWFPITDYTVDRFAADLHISVPSGFRVIASGLEGPPSDNGGKLTYSFSYKQQGFPGSIAVVQGQPVRVSSGGVNTTVYFRDGKAAANAWGEETGKVLQFLTGIYGIAPQSALTLIETEAGTPSGYAGPGIIFLSPKALGATPNSRLLANQIARQWWGLQVSPATRNHMWLVNGSARYAELMWVEAQSGAGAMESDVRDSYVEALTLDNIPVIQSGRLEDYSPEYWAATAGKRAAVLHMLRYLIGDDKFKETLKTFLDQFAGKSVTTDDFRQVAEKVSGQKLDYFFLEWIESSGAPEFKSEYTVFRTPKGFRVMGKIAQDLDTFRMPVEIRVETEGNPEDKKVEVSGTSSEFVVETFGKPKTISVDPNGRVLKYNRDMRVAVAIRRGEMFVEIGELNEALKEYQKALDVARNSSLAHYRVASVFMLQHNYQSAANEFRESLNGDLEPKWTEVWSHINLGKIFDMTGQRDRAVNEYTLAVRTKDNSQGALEEASKYLKQPYERPRQNL
jgi:aminopeptidase N